MRLRFFLFVLMLVCVACGPQAPAALSLPQTVADWRLADTATVSATDNPTWTAKYRGTPDLTVRLTRLSSNTLAFSQVQNWRAEPGKLAFFHGRYFGIAEAPGVDQRTLNRFVSALEKTLPE